MLTLCYYAFTKHGLYPNDVLARGYDEKLFMIAALEYKAEVENEWMKSHNMSSRQ